MRPVQAIMDMLRSPHAIARGIANESEMLNQKFDVLSQAMDNQSKLLNERLKALIQGMDNQSRLLDDKLYKLDAMQNNLRSHEAVHFFDKLRKACAIRPKQPAHSPQGSRS